MQGELSIDDETAQPTCGNDPEGNRGLGCLIYYIGNSREYHHPWGWSIAGSRRFETGFGVNETKWSEEHN
jgi:hypothetical protein